MRVSRTSEIWRAALRAFDKAVHVEFPVSEFATNRELRAVFAKLTDFTPDGPFAEHHGNQSGKNYSTTQEQQRELKRTAKSECR
jgi:hypothetical protein